MLMAFFDFFEKKMKKEKKQGKSKKGKGKELGTAVRSTRYAIQPKKPC
jgi:hypothetical protein